MSSFMVADKTINRIVTWLRRELTESNYLREQLQERLSMDVVESGFEEQPGQAMFELNIKGVNTRYSDKPAAQFRPLDYSCKSVFAVKIEVLKALQCWLYQCAEGDVPNNPVVPVLQRGCNTAFDVQDHKWDARVRAGRVGLIENGPPVLHNGAGGSSVSKVLYFVWRLECGRGPCS
jgi:hypothetical protein